VNITALGWLVVLLAVCAANLPFMNQQLFGVVTLNREQTYIKPFWVRLIELCVLYVVVGGVAHLLESHVGSVFSQTWEFYVITACLFLVLAYPGYVYRYLRKQSRTA
jgi:uncharacterized membrane protein AbrB (regulator of aidB expression)